MMIRVNPMSAAGHAALVCLEQAAGTCQVVSVECVGPRCNAGGTHARVPWPEQVPQGFATTEPVVKTELRAAVPLYLRKSQPGPLAQVEALLNWLQKLYPPGALLRAAHVEHECYPLFLEQKGWRPQPCGSRKRHGQASERAAGSGEGLAGIVGRHSS